MKSNTITAYFDKSRESRTSHLWQYDYGQILKIKGINLPDGFEAHFSNDRNQGTSKTSIGNNNMVKIPDQYLIKGKDIFVWIYLHYDQEDGQTVYTITIPVTPRAMPSDEAPTPQEESALTKAIALFNQVLGKVQNSYEIHYPIINNDIWYFWDNQNNEYISSGVSAKGTKGDPGIQGPEGRQGETGLQGPKGDTGISIENIVLNNDYTLTITFSDGQEYTTPSIRGQKGQQGPKGEQGQTGLQGNGIENIVLNNDYTLTIFLTDGTSRTFPSVRGEKGDTGNSGDQGPKGDTGERGQVGPQGNGIESVILNSNYTLTITFTNGQEYTTPSIRGQRGLQGIKGDTGQQGPAGYSPTAIVSKNNNITTITITDQSGTSTAQIEDGSDYVLTNQDKNDIATLVSSNTSLYDKNVGLDIDTSDSNLVTRIKGKNIEIFDNNNKSVAFFGLDNNNITTNRIGYNDSAHNIINTKGIQFYGESIFGDLIPIVDINHSIENSTQKTYYTFGTRVNNSLIGDKSFVIGSNITASNTGSYAEGTNTVSTGEFSHAEGNGSSARGNYSHAEGRANAFSEYSHAEGNSEAKSAYSHSEGSGTTAQGVASHAEGFNCTTNGMGSHAGGIDTIASSMAQTVIGYKNIEDSQGKYLFIIGNGSDEVGLENYLGDQRSNALTVDWDGNLIISGNLTQTPIVGEISYNQNWRSYSQEQTPILKKAGNVVTFQGAFGYSGEEFTSSASLISICTLPTEFRPSNMINSLCQGNGTDIWLMRIATTGVVSIARYRGADGNFKSINQNSWLVFDTSWIIN